MMLTPNPNPSHDVNANPNKTNKTFKPNHDVNPNLGHGVKSDPALTQTWTFADL